MEAPGRRVKRISRHPRTLLDSRDGLLRVDLVRRNGVAAEVVDALNRITLSAHKERRQRKHVSIVRSDVQSDRTRLSDGCLRKSG
eukprot:365087-Chlamydomonas_euryale.AAC.11